MGGVVLLVPVFMPVTMPVLVLCLRAWPASPRRSVDDAPPRKISAQGNGQSFRATTPASFPASGSP
jgi:hypothetical protein